MMTELTKGEGVCFYSSWEKRWRGLVTGRRLKRLNSVMGPLWEVGPVHRPISRWKGKRKRIRN